MRFFALAFFVLIILFYFMTINIKIDFHLKNKKKEWMLYIKTLFGLINFKVDLSYIKMKLDGSKHKLERAQEKKDDLKKEKGFSMEELKNMANHTQEVFEKYKNPIQYFFDKLRIKKLHLSTEYDLEDASITGILTGCLYALQSNILFWITNYKTIQDCHIKIHPLFQQENRISINFSCIIQFKLGHIINGSIKSLFLLKRR